MAQKLVAYQAPTWASSLKYIPTKIVKLAMTPTPITGWKLPGAPDDFQVLIKRDDLTGSTLSGNKVRKLEFILSDAIQKSCHHVITTGAAQSNHCRAVAVACAELGLQSHLVLRTDITDVNDVAFDGNMLVDKLCGAQVYLVPKKYLYLEDLEPKLIKLGQDIEEKTGKKTYICPVGGSFLVGVWGYIQCFEEIRQQGVEFDDLVCVLGSGGTAAGLAIANYLCGSPYRIHGIRVTEALDFHKYVNEMLAEIGIVGVESNDIIHFHDDYTGRGYGLNTTEEFDFMARTAQETGILLDNSYTGKAAYGLSDLLQKKPDVFKGKRVLFLHSGGSISLHAAGTMNALLPHSTKAKISFL